MIYKNVFFNVKIHKKLLRMRDNNGIIHTIASTGSHREKVIVFEMYRFVDENASDVFFCHFV